MEFVSISKRSGAVVSWEEHSTDSRSSDTAMRSSVESAVGAADGAMASGAGCCQFWGGGEGGGVGGARGAGGGAEGSGMGLPWASNLGIMLPCWSN